MENKFIFVLMGDGKIKGFGKSPENIFENACVAHKLECNYRAQTFSRVQPRSFREVTLPVELRK